MQGGDEGGIGRKSLGLEEGEGKGMEGRGGLEEEV